MPGGRPTRYRKSYADKAYRLCRDLGLTDTQLADIFDVSEATITNWKHKHKKFLVSLKKGKDEYDSEVVEKSLRRRALGYEYKETTREMRGGIDIKTGEGKLSVSKEVTKQVVPDVTAQIFWLKNRNPQRWRDRQQHELTGADGGPIVYEPIDRFVLSNEEDPPAEKSPEDTFP